MFSVTTGSFAATILFRHSNAKVLPAPLVTYAQTVICTSLRTCTCRVQFRSSCAPGFVLHYVHVPAEFSSEVHVLLDLYFITYMYLQSSVQKFMCSWICTSLRTCTCRVQFRSSCAPGFALGVWLPPSTISLSSSSPVSSILKRGTHRLTSR